MSKEHNLSIVCHNYLGHILANELSMEGRNIKLIDTPQYNYGDLTSNIISYLDKEFFETWGKDREIKALRDMQPYLSSAPFEFCFDDYRICLGNTPSQNLLEMIRKIPDFLVGYDDLPKLIKELVQNPENFDRSYFEFCHLVAANIFRYKSFQNLLIEDFLIHCPDHLKKLYEVFQETWFKKIRSLDMKEDSKKGLMYLFRSIYQNKISIQTSEFEVFHLFLTLLGPKYSVDNEKVKKDLAHKGGFEVKSNQLSGFDMSWGKVSSIDLDEKKEELETNQIFFLTSYPPEEIMELPRISDAYSNIKFKIENKEDFGFLGRSRYIYSTSHYLGTRMPFVEIYWDKTNIRGNAVLKKQDADKVEFHTSFIKTNLKKLLKNFYPQKELNITCTEFEAGHDFYYLQSDWQNMKREKLAHFPISRKFRLLSEDKNRFIKVKNANYFGPLKDGPLGLLSLLMELKDSEKLIN